MTGEKVSRNNNIRNVARILIPPFVFIKKLIESPIAYIHFLRDFLYFKKAVTDNRFSLKFTDHYACMNDKTLSTGFDGHYVYHTAWAARILSKTRPAVHIDISSFLFFSTIVSAFVPVEFYDYRPANLTLDNLTSRKADLTSLPFSDMSIHSLSCMHTVEHIGLGRYGDPIDPEGDIGAISELKRVLARGGTLLFVVPIGSPKIQFNAHRIYSYDQILSYFSDLKLEEFALIPDNSNELGMIYNATKTQADSQSYGCGCFWFRRD